MNIKSAASDDRDVLLMAISDLTEQHREGRFVVIIKEDETSKFTIYYSDEIEDCISLLEEAEEVQLKGLAR